MHVVTHMLGYIFQWLGLSGRIKPFGYNDLWRRLGKRGGFTAANGKPIEPVTGYAVAVHGLETQVSWNVLTPVMFRVIDERYRELADIYAFYGAWLDKEANVVYFDVVQIYLSLADAMIAAKAHLQKAIYGFALQETIKVESA